MALWTTNTLARTIEYVQCFCGLRPLTGIGNNLTTFPYEPACSIGDWVRQTILGPPFAWRWNRKETSTINILQSSQDYTVSLNDFGWIERAMIWGNADCPSKELVIRNSLASDQEEDEPSFIAVHKDDNNGSIIFRLLPMPYAAYSMVVTYQMACPSFSNSTAPASATWAPLPDYLSYVYNAGFLAKAYEQSGSDKAPWAMQTFFQLLASAAEGLSDEQRSIVVRHLVADNAGLNQKQPVPSVRYNIAERG